MLRAVKIYARWLLGLLLVIGALAGFHLLRTRREHRHDAAIVAAARRYQLDPALVKAVVWRESFFDAAAHGRAGEVGLMQITELAAEEWAEAERLQNFQLTQLFDPARNAQAGAWYLRKLLGRYTRTDNPFAYALADYNAGRTHVLRWNKGVATTNSAAFLAQIDFPGTKNYVEAVLRRFEDYKPQFAPAAAK
ncbi:MAG: lytic transglycosylase domain-containing protein [Verrucomicrobia bacterium]|nr:lytic transglycosylase domain-containing protein [Verrucomicrobiota bacterium]